MGRKVRRVALDFDWPLEKPWKGFINPHYERCPAEKRGECFGGVTAGRRYLSAIVQLLAVAGGNAATGRQRPNIIWPHPYISDLPMTPRRRENEYASGAAVGPSPDLADLTAALAGRRPDRFFGHDSSDQWGIEKAIITAAGLPEKWGYCPVCDGHGQDPASREAYEAWKETEPPTGPGYQMWETVSEGSPISPVFETPEALAEWLTKEGNRRYQTTRGVSFDAWVTMIREEGDAPSMIGTHGGPIVSGVEALYEQKKGKKKK